MIKDKTIFNKEIDFFNYTIDLINQYSCLDDKLHFYNKINILEIYKPYLILYVFPNILSKNSFFSFFRSIKLLIKIIVKCKSFSNYSLIVDSELPFDGKNKKKVGLIKFTKHFFDESLSKFFKIEHQNLVFSTLNIVCENFENSFDYKSLLNKYYLYKKLIKIIKLNHKKYINKFGSYNRIEFHLSLLYLVFNVIPSHSKFIKDVVENKKLLNFDTVIFNDFTEPISRFLMILCQELGVNTVVIQHGVTSLTYPEWKFNFSDYTFVSGEKTKEHIEFQNPNLKNVFITGVPNFDLKISFKPRNNKVHYILLATQPYFPHSFHSRWQRHKIFLSIIFLSLRSSNVKLVIKPHPSESIVFYKILTFIFFNLKLTNKSIIEAFDECDIFVTSFSQTSIYSSLIGIPTINVFLSKKSCHVDFIYAGATLLIEKYRDLKYYFCNIKDVYNYDYNVNKLSPWIHTRDNNSINRITELLSSI